MNKKNKALLIFTLFSDLTCEIYNNYINYLSVPAYHKAKKTNFNYNKSLNFQGFILNLYSTFQKYLCKLFKIQLAENPKEYFSNEDVKFSKLIDNNFNKQKIINMLIENRIENFTRGISDIITLCQNLGIVNVGSFSSLKYDYEEFCCRRNIYAHGIEYITKEYKDVDKNISQSWLNKDSKLIENEKYLEHCIDLICKMFFQIYFELNISNRKIINFESIAVLEDAIYEIFYKRKSWKISMYIYEKLKNIKGTIKNYNTELYKQIFYMNCLYCKKKLGHDISDKLKQINFKHAKEKFEIVKDTLLENYDSVFSKFQTLQNKQVQDKFKITFEELKTWPVFEDFRQTTQYKYLLKENENN